MYQKGLFLHQMATFNKLYIIIYFSDFYNQVLLTNSYIY